MATKNEAFAVTFANWKSGWENYNKQMRGLGHGQLQRLDDVLAGEVGNENAYSSVEEEDYGEQLGKLIERHKIDMDAMRRELEWSKQQIADKDAETMQLKDILLKTPQWTIDQLKQQVDTLKEELRRANEAVIISSQQAKYCRERLANYVDPIIASKIREAQLSAEHSVAELTSEKKALEEENDALRNRISEMSITLAHEKETHRQARNDLSSATRFVSAALGKTALQKLLVSMSSLAQEQAMKTHGIAPEKVEPKVFNRLADLEARLARMSEEAEAAEERRLDNEEERQRLISMSEL